MLGDEITKMDLYKMIDENQRRLERRLWIYLLKTKMKEVFKGARRKCIVK